MECWFCTCKLIRLEGNLEWTGSDWAQTLKCSKVWTQTKVFWIWVHYSFWCDTWEAWVLGQVSLLTSGVTQSLSLDLWVSVSQLVQQLTVGCPPMTPLHLFTLCIWSHFDVATYENVAMMPVSISTWPTYLLTHFSHFFSTHEKKKCPLENDFPLIHGFAWLST